MLSAIGRGANGCRTFFDSSGYWLRVLTCVPAVARFAKCSSPAPIAIRLHPPLLQTLTDSLVNLQSMFDTIENVFDEAVAARN